MHSVISVILLFYILQTIKQHVPLIKFPSRLLPKGSRKLFVLFNEMMSDDIDHTAESVHTKRVCTYRNKYFMCTLNCCLKYVYFGENLSGTI